MRVGCGSRRRLGGGGEGEKRLGVRRIGRRKTWRRMRLILGRSELFDLFYKVSLFVVELLILGSIRVKLGQELDQFLLIA